MFRTFSIGFARTAWALALGLASMSAQAVSSNIVVSQVYGAGGNTGAVYNADYIELFNRGAGAQSLNGWSVQYASSAGTGNFSALALPNVSVAPGQYFLIRMVVGATGAAVPTPDHTGTIAMAGGAGKVIVANVSTSLACNGGSTPCSAGQLAQIVDLVGYGTGTNFFEGSGPTATISSTLAAFRAANGCTDTDSNSTDFATATPSPRNTASTLAPCTGPTSPSGVGASNPNNGLAGASTLLTVTVTPGTSPASTGLTVTCNLSNIGGGASQAFFDNNTNGDVTASDNIFSFQATIGAVAPGVKANACTISDAQLRNGAANIAYTVNVPPPAAVTIAQIQGSGNTSPYANLPVTTTGIVTGRKSNGYFLQDPAADANPATSEGIFVFTGSGVGQPPAGAVPGASVTLSATVTEFVPSQDPYSPSTTELITTTAFVVNSTGNPLPAAIALTAADTNPNGTMFQLERFEGMRVSLNSLTVVAPTSSFVDEPSATATTDGVFYGVITGIDRPFRETGVLSLNVPAIPCVPGPCLNQPVFDENPERLRIDSDALGAPALNVGAGAVISGLVGPLDYTFRAYMIDQDANAPAPTVVGGMVAIPASGAFPSEFSVAAANIERFFDTVNDPAIGEPVLTPAALTRRLAKASLMIRNVLLSPDVLAVIEVENLSVLQSLATKVNNDAAGSVLYVPYLIEGNDVGGIDVGFLVNTKLVGNGHSRVELNPVPDDFDPGTPPGITQYNKTQTYINPTTNLPELLNDRPSLILRATVFHESGLSSYPVTIVVNHLRSLNGADDDTTGGNRVRVKRRAQAESNAALMQSLQGENVISLGDFNAFEFSDGLGDSMGTIVGDPTPQNEVVLASPDLVNPNLTNVSALEPDDERYSFSFDGNAQTLDHVLVNQNASQQYSGISHPRVNADFQGTLRNDDTRPERIADHDPIASYFMFPITSDVDATPSTQALGSDVTYNVTVAPDAIQNASLLPATVSFDIDGVSQGPAAPLFAAPAGTLAGGLSNAPLVGVSPGPHTVTAQFSNSNIPDATTSITVQKATPTLTIVSDTPDPSLAAQAYLVTVSLTGGYNPTGTIVVSDGTDSCNIVLPALSCNLTSTTIGAKTLTANYPGDANNNADAAPTAPHQVNCNVPVLVKKSTKFTVPASFIGSGYTLTDLSATSAGTQIDITAYQGTCLSPTAIDFRTSNTSIGDVSLGHTTPATGGTATGVLKIGTRLYALGTTGAGQAMWKVPFDNAADPLLVRSSPIPATPACGLVTLPAGFSVTGRTFVDQDLGQPDMQVSVVLAPYGGPAPDRVTFNTGNVVEAITTSIARSSSATTDGSITFDGRCFNMGGHVVGWGLNASSGRIAWTPQFSAAAAKVVDATMGVVGFDPPP